MQHVLMGPTSPYGLSHAGLAWLGLAYLIPALLMLASAASAALAWHKLMLACGVNASLVHPTQLILACGIHRWPGLAQTHADLYRQCQPGTC